MRRILTHLAIILVCVLPVLAFTAALLIVVPAPSYMFALASVAVTEKSFVPGTVGLVVALIAGRVLRGGRRALVNLVRVVGLATFALCLVPPVQALRVARESGTNLDLGRYLLSSLDHGGGEAPRTVQFTEIAGRSLYMDVYPAAGATPSTPRRAIVIVHGGGWNAGDKGEGSQASAWLASRGFHVFDVQYRLAPEGRWREATADIKCAVGFIKRANNRDFGLTVDPDRVALLGRSAGGQLAMLAAFAADDDTLPASCPTGDASVDSVISFYGPTDLRWGYEHPSNPRVYDTSGRLRGFLGGPPSGVGDPYDRASPTVRAHAGAPPVLLIHGGRDQFVSPLHIGRLQAKLAPQGVLVRTLEIPYARHGFDFVFGGLGGQLAEAAILRFFNEVDARKTTGKTTTDGGSPGTPSARPAQVRVAPTLVPGSSRPAPQLD
jgi:acetyl esterase/lipase